MYNYEVFTENETYFIRSNATYKIAKEIFMRYFFLDFLGITNQSIYSFFQHFGYRAEDILDTEISLTDMLLSRGYYAIDLTDLGDILQEELKNQ